MNKEVPFSLEKGTPSQEFQPMRDRLRRKWAGRATEEVGGRAVVLSRCSEWLCTLSSPFWEPQGLLVILEILVVRQSASLPIQCGVEAGGSEVPGRPLLWGYVTPCLKRKRGKKAVLHTHISVG